MLAALQLVDAHLEVIEVHGDVLGIRLMGSRRNPADRSTPTRSSAGTSGLHVRCLLIELVAGHVPGRERPLGDTVHNVGP